MVDCLSLLRSYNLHRKEIVERDEFIIFDQSAFPRSTKTNYQIFKAGVDKTPKDYYTLETLLFLLKHASLIHAHYLPKANNAKIPPIRFPDRRSLLNYLNGEIDTAPGIDKNGPMDMPVPPPPLKRNLIASGLDDSASRTKHEDNRKKRPANDEHIVLKLIPEDQIKNSDLGSTMPEGKINEIKTKRFLRKRTTIQAADDIESGAPHVAIIGFQDGAVDSSRDIMEREKLLRNRSTILDSSGLNFSNILNVLSQIKSSEDGRNNYNIVSIKPPTISHVHKSSNRQHTYSRYYQEQQPTKDVSGFEIDTAGSYRIQKSTDLESVKYIQSSGSLGKVDEERQTSSKRESRTPIIIVPAALTSVITLQNAKEFLQDEKYVPISVVFSQAVGDILIQRRKIEPGTSKFYTVPYRIIDSPAKLRPNDWNRVVAVFVAGPQWQFKGWPGLSMDGSPVEIFVKIRGFHLKFIESPLEANIKKWNVTILEISKTKRHLDKVAVNRFWEITDSSISNKLTNNKFKV